MGNLSGLAVWGRYGMNIFSKAGLQHPEATGCLFECLKQKWPPTAGNGQQTREEPLTGEMEEVKGSPGATRTHDHPLRRRVLYPTELRGHSQSVESLSVVSTSSVYQQRLRIASLPIVPYLPLWAKWRVGNDALLRPNRGWFPTVSPTMPKPACWQTPREQQKRSGARITPCAADGRKISTQIGSYAPASPRT